MVDQWGLALSPDGLIHTHIFTHKCLTPCLAVCIYVCMERDSKKIVSRLQREGWTFASARGSHHKFTRDGATIIVPHPKKNLPIGTARSIAKAAGWI